MVSLPAPVTLHDLVLCLQLGDVGLLLAQLVSGTARRRLSCFQAGVPLTPCLLGGIHLTIISDELCMSATTA